jgi:plastocyanin domain-containing protein
MKKNLPLIARALGAVLLVSALAGCGGTKSGSSTTAQTPGPVAASGAQEVRLTVTDKGFEPAEITVEKDRPIVLTVTRKTDATCAKEIVFKGMDVRRDLPLNEDVRIELPAHPSGTLEYACGMDMIKGSLVVR